MTWLKANTSLIADLTALHVWLSIPPIILGLIFALPIGVFAWRSRLFRGPLLVLTGLLYTIPSLALFVLLPPILGISFLSSLNLTVALTLYAVALMTRFTADAFASIDETVRQSATAIGYSPWQRFWSVELPLAGPALLAGLRVVAVSTVSLVTVGVLVGIRSLGFLFMNGLQRGIPAEILTGIVLTLIIAVALDLILMLIGRALMPWARKNKNRRRSTTREKAPA